LDETDWRWLKQYVETFPIFSATPTQQAEIAGLVDKILSVKKGKSTADTSVLEAQIDSIGYRIYRSHRREIAVVVHG